MTQWGEARVTAWDTNFSLWGPKLSSRPLESLVFLHNNKWRLHMRDQKARRLAFKIKKSSSDSLKSERSNQEVKGRNNKWCGFVLFEN